MGALNHGTNWEAWSSINTQAVKETGGLMQRRKEEKKAEGKKKRREEREEHLASAAPLATPKPTKSKLGAPKTHPDQKTSPVKLR